MSATDEREAARVRGKLTGRIKGTCAMCGMPGHRYGTTDPHHEYSAVACINSLKPELAAIRKALVAAAEDMEDMLPYVGAYFTEKWGYDAALARLKAAAGPAS